MATQTVALSLDHLIQPELLPCASHVAFSGQWVALRHLKRAALWKAKLQLEQTKREASAEGQEPPRPAPLGYDDNVTPDEVLAFVGPVWETLQRLPIALGLVEGYQSWTQRGYMYLWQPIQNDKSIWSQAPQSATPPSAPSRTNEERELLEASAQMRARREAARIGATAEEVWEVAVQFVKPYVYDFDEFVVEHNGGTRWMTPTEATEHLSSEMPKGYEGSVTDFLYDQLANALDALANVPTSNDEFAQAMRESLPVDLMQRMCRNLPSIVVGITRRDDALAGMYAGRPPVLQQDSNETDVVTAHAYGLGVLAYGLAAGLLGDLPTFFDGMSDDDPMTAAEKREFFYKACRALVAGHRNGLVVAARKWDEVFGFDSPTLELALPSTEVSDEA